MVFGEKPGHCCCIQIHNIGVLMPAESQLICQRICDLLSRELNIHPERIYLIFRPVDGHHWGWNHTTFA
jgi:phenylpyruvate tautomerase PptA (4-oxalocrotonate tautomerase family)